MINLKYTIIDEQHNKITEDEIAINNFNELRTLKHWFLDYRAKYPEYDNRQTIVVVTMSVIREDYEGRCTDTTDYVVYGPITTIADSVKHKFEQHVFRNHWCEYLK